MTFKFFLTMKSSDVPTRRGLHQPEAQVQRPHTLHLGFTVGAMVSPQGTQLSHSSLFPLTGEALGKLCPLAGPGPARLGIWHTRAHPPRGCPPPNCNCLAPTLILAWHFTYLFCLLSRRLGLGVSGSVWCTEGAQYTFFSRQQAESNRWRERLPAIAAH